MCISKEQECVGCSRRMIEMHIGCPTRIKKGLRSLSAQGKSSRSDLAQRVLDTCEFGQVTMPQSSREAMVQVQIEEPPTWSAHTGPDLV